MRKKDCSRVCATPTTSVKGSGLDNCIKSPEMCDAVVRRKQKELTKRLHAALFHFIKELCCIVFSPLSSTHAHKHPQSFFPTSSLLFCCCCCYLRKLFACLHVPDKVFTTYLLSVCTILQRDLLCVTVVQDRIWEIVSPGSPGC